MTRLLIGSSLKMYFGRERTRIWSTQVAGICRNHPAVVAGRVECFVIPSFPSIPEVIQAARGAMLVGAQDAHWADSGAYTGEVSCAELAEHGVQLVEIGHAERRRLFGETDEIVARKCAAALRNGLAPVICIGEMHRTEPAVAARECIAQLEASLSQARRKSLSGRLVIAYEPVWAIGAPEPAGERHIRGVCATLRRHLKDDGTFPDAAVIYGGSAGPGLLPRIADAVDGMFLGRFAHEPVAFGAILDEALALVGGTDEHAAAWSI